MSETQTIEVDEEVVEAVSKKATANIDKAIDEKLKGISIPTADEIATAMAEKTEKVAKKNIHDDEGGDKTDAHRTSLKKGFETLPKEVRFAKAVKAWIGRDTGNKIGRAHV